MRFDNQIVLVTGSARGIGYVIAEKFLGCGATVVISDLRQEDVDKAVAQLAAAGGKVAGHECNVTDEDSVNGLVDRVVEQFGQLDVLVNNAGITRDTLALRMKTEQWKMVLDTNLTGTFLCCRAAIKHMIRVRSGRIINISSVVGLIGNAGQCNYSASKAGGAGSDALTGAGSSEPECAGQRDRAGVHPYRHD
jgi:3-oxoacyl-[acyl-carrier protein] reductase